MKRLLIATLFVFCFGVTSCKCDSQIVTDIKACATGEVAKKWPDLVDTVKTILAGGKVNWKDQLKALEVLGVDVVVCAVHVAVDDLKKLVSDKLKVSPTASQPDNPAVQRGLEYLKAKGVK